ncbi:jg15933 [Pararge aegeria aegeria]|uniref:Jg15933 protein n=1 Tax=Pararge aegeria aegeria TaxID=348720 RepID=A0A8S4R213_9NEOP|nr:jg15933 [Pararge aegeria aegeria]
MNYIGSLTVFDHKTQEWQVFYGPSLALLDARGTRCISSGRLPTTPSDSWGSRANEENIMENSQACRFPHDVFLHR